MIVPSNRHKANIRACIKCNKEKQFSGMAFKRKVCYDCSAKSKSDYALKYSYGLSIEEVKALVDGQDNKCLICSKESKLEIDHCHNTGKVRGLLCHKCNVALGFFEDNLEYLKKAIEYLS